MDDSEDMGSLRPISAGDVNQQPFKVLDVLASKRQWVGDIQVIERTIYVQ